MHATGRQSLAGRTASDGAPLHYERHRPEQTTLYRLVQQHAASFIAHTEASTGAELPRFVRGEFDAILECGILAHGFLRLRCGECGHDKVQPLTSASGNSHWMKSCVTSNQASSCRRISASIRPRSSG